jgi:cytochrome c553
MKKLALLAVILLIPAAQADLEWVYQKVDKGRPPNHYQDDAVRTVPGSTQTYTQAEVDDQWNPPDWFPQDHAPMPEVVSHGAGEHVRACASCHLVSGMGHPESSQTAGLPVAYMLRQMHDFGSGARKDRFWMNEFGAAISDEDSLAAAEYFSALKPLDWIDVQEAAQVPKTYFGEGRMRFRHPDGGMEPIGNRIIELPKDEELVTARHPYSGFIAYVPPGSLAKGRELATTGGMGKTLQCAICHGEGLKGLGDVPRIAGLSPVYVVRELNDIKTGARAGTSVALMQATVANLTEEDIVALAAYVASLDP